MDFFRTRRVYQTSGQNSILHGQCTLQLHCLDCSGLQRRTQKILTGAAHVPLVPPGGSASGGLAVYTALHCRYTPLPSGRGLVKFCLPSNIDKINSDSMSPAYSCLHAHSDRIHAKWSSRMHPEWTSMPLLKPRPSVTIIPGCTT